MFGSSELLVIREWRLKLVATNEMARIKMATKSEDCFKFGPKIPCRAKVATKARELKLC